MAAQDEMNVLGAPGSHPVRNACKNMTQGVWGRGGVGESSFVLEQQTRSSVAATEHHHNQIPAL